MCIPHNCNFRIDLHILHSSCKQTLHPNLRNLYTGLLLARLYRVFPKTTTYGSLGREIFGRAGELTGYVVLYSYIFLLLGEFLIVMARCVQEMFYSTAICRPWAGVITCCLLFFSNQIRDLHKISFLSIVRFNYYEFF